MATARASQPFDRLPPQSIEAERSVLGAMLLNGEAVGPALEILREKPGEVFYGAEHQHIYGAVLDLFRRNVPIDAVTLVEQLRRNGTLEAAGGVSYIAELGGAVPTSANAEHYARIVLQAAILRRLISVCGQVTSEAFDNPRDVDALLDRAEASIFSIAEARQLNPIYRVSDLLQETVERIEAQIEARVGYSGLPTGFHSLDELLSGLQNSDMIVLAARPSVGKTAFALNIASHVAIHEKKAVLMFSLEMAKEQLTTRLLCMEGRINSKRLRTGFLAKHEFPKLTAAAGKLHDADIFIDDTPNISILDLRSKARRHRSQHKLDLVIIDYLQLMTSPGRNENRQTEIAEISRSIKGIARELQVPVIALSQLSREAEKDDMGAPKLSHLRESGAIEQDADVVLMLSRPPAYKRSRGGDEPAEADPDLEKTIHVSIAKQRNGPTGDFTLFFDRNIQRFQEPTAAGRAAPPPGGRHDDGSAGYGDDFDDEPPLDDGAPFDQMEPPPDPGEVPF